MSKFRKGISGLLAFVMIFSAFVCNMAVTASAEPTQTLWVVGDSTACNYKATDDATYYYKRVGYGDQLASYFDPSKIKVENLALGGRSSKSFVTDSNGGYDKMRSGIKKGDILLIAFGHNDEKSDDAARYTTPAQDINDTESFAYSLKTNYIDVAKNAEATAVVCSPIVRLPKDLKAFSNSDIHNTNGGDYAEAAKYAANQAGAEFIDLTALTKAKYQNDFKAAAKYHAWTADATKPEDKYSADNLNINRIDTTHINNYGAKMIAHLIATNLPDGSALEQYLIQDAAAPTEADLNYNDAYIEPDNSDKTGDDLVNAWEVTAPWHTTFFGQSSGKTKYTVTEEDGSVHMATATGADGKLTAGNAGIAMYYQDFAAGGPVELHALAHINKYSYANQTGFGAVINDNIVINNSAEEAYSKAVFASPFLGKYSSFSKNDNTFEYGPELSTLDLDGVDEVNVDIIKLGDQFAVNFGGATKVYTVEGMSDRAYAGIFVSRDADITFTNVYAGIEVPEGTDINNLIKHNDFSAVLNCKNSVDGNGVTDVTVTDADGSPVSPAEGKYTLTDGKVYTVSAPGYVAKKVLAISRYATRDIALTPSAQITLNVTPEDAEYTVKDASGNVIAPVGDNVYDLVPGVEYTVSADGYKDQKFTASADQPTVDIQLEKIDISNVQSFDYWFDAQGTDNLKKNTYYFGGGEVTLYSDFSAQKGYSNGAHTSYQGASTEPGKALGSDGKAVQAGKQIIPTGGNAYSFKPYADGTVKFYGANGNPAKNFDILVVGDNGVPVGNAASITNTDAKVPQEYDVKANYTYYVFGNSGSGDSAFLGFEYTVAKNVTINGTIARTNNEGLTDDLHTITFTPKLGDAVTADITGDKFEVTLIAGKEYSVKTDSSLLMITDPQTITVTEDMGTNGLTVNMTRAKDEIVTGQVYGLDKYDGVTITFTKDSAVKTVSSFDPEGKYTVELQPGTWNVDASDVAGYTLSSLSENDLVVKQSSDPTAENWKNILYKAPVQPATANKVYVDGADKGADHYDTISDAIAGLKSGSQTKGATVVLTSGQTYTEQVIVDIENVRFETSGSEPATISWYYGIGYTYYSAYGGFYNEDYAVDRHARGKVDKWGTAVRVTKPGFEAENIVFINTFNINVVPEEVTDGVKADKTAYPDTTITLDRTVENFNAKTKAATERAAAMVLDSGNAAFENCKFYSSQDTIYSVGNIYFKNCLISGETDYLFNNSGTVIIDKSKLEWKGYDDTRPAPGYITAARGKYIFRDCEITKGTEKTLSGADIPVGKGYFGRPWDKTADVIFINTKTNDLIEAAGWADMSGRLVEDVKMFGSYKSTALDGSEFKTTAGTNLTEAQLGNMLDPAYDMEYFTPEWLPFNHDPYADVPGAVVTWDFAAGNTDLKTIQGTTGKVTTENSKLGSVVLDVDASNGKLADGGGKAQFNQGTIIKVPVFLEGDIITVEGYPSYGFFTLAGKAAENDTCTHTATKEDADRGYVEVVATGNAYLNSIKLETLYEPVPTTKVTWDFQNNNTDLVVGAQHQGGEQFQISVIDNPEWKLDVTAAGKITLRAEKDLQVNTDAVIKVPVAADGDKITVIAHANYLNFTVAGTPAAAGTTVYTATADDAAKGYVEVKGTGNSSYLYSISLETTGTPPVEEEMNDYNFDFVEEIGEAGVPTGTVKEIPSKSDSIQGTLTVDTTDNTYGTPKLRYNDASYGYEVSPSTKFIFTLSGEGSLNTKITIGSTYNAATNVVIKVYAADDMNTELGTITLNGESSDTISFTGEGGKEYVVVVTSGSNFYTKGLEISTAGLVEEKEPTTDITWTFAPDDNPTLPKDEVPQGNKVGYMCDKDSEAGDAPSVVLYVDTTATGAKFAPQNNVGQANKWTQINEGTVIKVPVYAAGDKITVDSYVDGSYTADYTIGTGSYTGNSWAYTANEADAAAGYVTLTKSNGQGYIGKLTLSTTGNIPAPELKTIQVIKKDANDGKVDVYVIAKIAGSAIGNVEGIGIGAGKHASGAYAEDSNVISSDYTGTVFEQIVIDEQSTIKEDGSYLAAVKISGVDINSDGVGLYAAPYSVINGKAVYDDVDNLIEQIKEP